MTADEMVTVARLADHYEGRLSAEHDPLEVAKHDFEKFKRDAPRLWRYIHASNRPSREIGDWLYDFFRRHGESGMSLKNFAADELDRFGGGKRKSADVSRRWVLQFQVPGGPRVWLTQKGTGSMDPDAAFDFGSREKADAAAQDAVRGGRSSAKYFVVSQDVK